MADTIPGGRYLVDGVWVDANGKPLPAHVVPNAVPLTDPVVDPVVEPDQEPKHKGKR